MSRDENRFLDSSVEQWVVLLAPPLPSSGFLTPATLFPALYMLSSPCGHLDSDFMLLPLNLQ